MYAARRRAPDNTIYHPTTADDATQLARLGRFYVTDPFAIDSSSSSWTEGPSLDSSRDRRSCLRRLIGALTASSSLRLYSVRRYG
jgi:hypothetical protein